MNNIRRLLKKVYAAHKDNFDTLWVITGLEGMGKSNLLLDIGVEWKNLTGQSFSMDNIGLTPQKWVETLESAPEKYGFSGFDEAGDGLLNRESMSGFNRDMVKLYTVIRGKGLFTILVLPSFWILDPYFRMHRVRGLFYVYARDSKTRYGKVAFWNKSQIKRMILWGEKNQDVWCVKPSLKDTFPMYKGELMGDYLKEKKDKIDSTIKSMKEKYSLDKEGTKTNDLLSSIKVST